MTRWENAQKHESNYWQNCYQMAAFGEVYKQELYAREMQIPLDATGEIDLAGKSILDLGCGPWSMMLRCINGGRLVGVDPLDWPNSVRRRYKNYGIEFIQTPAEELLVGGQFDEVWIYNVLQHVQDPAKIVEIAKRSAPITRIFEWVHIPADECHPHVLTPEGLMNWFAGCRVDYIGLPQVTGEFWSNATAFAGVFSKRDL